MSKSKVYIPTDEEFTNIVLNSNSYSDCLRQLGLSPKGGSSTDILKKRIYELGISTDHFNIKQNTRSAKYKMEEILIEHSTYHNIASLKRRLINEKYLEYKCAICGNLGIWNNQPLSLQLDHINGIHDDHRINNLRFLCPNCHSQTDSFAGKNKK